MAVLFPDAIPRPTCNTPAVRDEALDEMLKKVMQWFGKDAEHQDPDEVRKDLDDVLDADGFDDAYDIARQLDMNHGWCGVNAALVDLLEDWHWTIHRPLRKAVAAWVAECNIKPRLKVGDRVQCQRGSQEVLGEIASINAEQAEYVIRRATDAPGCGAILTFEAVEVTANA